MDKLIETHGCKKLVYITVHPKVFSDPTRNHVGLKMKQKICQTKIDDIQIGRDDEEQP